MGSVWYDGQLKCCKSVVQSHASERGNCGARAKLSCSASVARGGARGAGGGSSWDIAFTWASLRAAQMCAYPPLPPNAITSPDELIAQHVIMSPSVSTWHAHPGLSDPWRVESAFTSRIKWTDYLCGHQLGLHEHVHALQGLHGPAMEHLIFRF